MSELSKLMDRIKAVTGDAEITIIDYQPIGIRHISDVHIGIEKEKEQKEQLSILFMKSRALAKKHEISFIPRHRFSNINEMAGATGSKSPSNVRFKR